jgi:hypothetical protein
LYVNLHDVETLGHILGSYHSNPCLKYPARTCNPALILFSYSQSSWKCWEDKAMGSPWPVVEGNRSKFCQPLHPPGDRLQAHFLQLSRVPWRTGPQCSQQDTIKYIFFLLCVTGYSFLNVSWDYLPNKPLRPRFRVCFWNKLKHLIWEIKY